MKRTLITGFWAAALAHGLAAGGLSAQAPPVGEEDLDRVLAIVGDSIVLLSQVLQREAEMRAAGRPIPELPAERDRFLGDLLDDLVNHQIVLQAAVRDTLLSVDEDRVDEQLQQRITQTEQAFGGRVQMQEALLLEGLSIQTYREMLREQIRQQFLVGQYVARHTSQSAVEVTDLEMRTFFDEQRGGLAPRPATVTFKQVVLTVAPSDSSVSRARAQIDSLLTLVQAGEDFATLARTHSQDAASAEAGGDLGWARRGVFVDAFEDAAFNLLEGEVSEVVETPFGFHIIQVDQIRFSERRARHILIRPQIGQADMDETRSLAEDLVVRARSEPLEALIAEFHDPLMPDSATVPTAQIGQMLSPAYGSAIAGTSAGDVVGPVQFEFRGETRFGVVRIEEMREAGAYSYEDLKEQIRTELLRQKREDALVDNLRRTTYVERKVPSGP